MKIIKIICDKNINTLILCSKRNFLSFLPSLALFIDGTRICLLIKNPKKTIEQRINDLNEYVYNAKQLIKLRANPHK